MTHPAVQIMCAAIGTFGFSIFFRVRSAHLLFAVLGGILSWCVYLIADLRFDVFISTLLASFIVCLWAEIMARVRKAPATVFLVPGIIPLLPGSALYYTMSGIVSKDHKLFLSKGTETLYIAIGIVGGILFASELLRICFTRRHKTIKNA